MKAEEREKDRIIARAYILENVSPVLVNAEMNAEMLQGVPHERFLDLAVIFRDQLDGDRPLTTSLITNLDCEEFGISSGELMAAAMKSINEKDSFKVARISEFLGEALGESFGDAAAADEPLYVCTTEDATNGARIMLHPDSFSELSRRLGTDLYVLPSSIHEVIAIPVDVCEKDTLEEAVRLVNAEVVDPADVLGTTVYRFLGADGKFEIA